MTEKEPVKLFQLSSAPHIKTGDSVPVIMWTVMAALLPAAVYSVFLNGIWVLAVMAAAVVSAIAAEAAFQFLFKKKFTALDGSAAVTGILVAMNVPPGVPLWLVVAGSIFAILIVKQVFGGIGFNIFNPALAARAFLMASWPVYMTTGWHRFSPANSLSGSIININGIPQEAFDAMTQATPLSLVREGPRILQDFGIGVETLHRTLFSPEMLKSLFIGNIGGCIGETSAMFLLLGGAILLVRRIITWHIPVSFIGTVAAVYFIYYSATGFDNAGAASLFQILSGGVFLGAFFMATDMVTSPVTATGMILFGAGCGLITFVIRVWGGYPEGVSYSILIMNAFVPLIDRYVKPKVFGT